jgi:hypothetical protein
LFKGDETAGLVSIVRFSKAHEDIRVIRRRMKPRLEISTNLHSFLAALSDLGATARVAKVEEWV